jgi:hypothetical protein
MEVVKQITQEQLETITKQQAQKHALLHQVAEVNQTSEAFKAELEKEYGAINIDLSDGSYTEIVPEETTV